MPQQISLGGIYFPGALALLVLMLPVFYLLDIGLARLGVYRRAANPSLIRVALFSLLYSASTLFLLW